MSDRGAKKLGFLVFAVLISFIFAINPSFLHKSDGFFMDFACLRNPRGITADQTTHALCGAEASGKISFTVTANGLTYLNASELDSGFTINELTPPNTELESERKFVPQGKRFDYWCYADTREKAVFPLILDKAIALDAVFCDIIIKVSYYDGSDLIISPDLTSELPYDGELPQQQAVAKSGYEFIDWCYDAGLVDACVFPIKHTTADFSLYAKYRLIPVDEGDGEADPNGEGVGVGESEGEGSGSGDAGDTDGEGDDDGEGEGSGNSNSDSESEGSCNSNGEGDGEGSGGSGGESEGSGSENATPPAAETPLEDNGTPTESGTENTPETGINEKSALGSDENSSWFFGAADTENEAAIVSESTDNGNPTSVTWATVFASLAILLCFLGIGILTFQKIKMRKFKKNQSIKQEKPRI